MKSETMKRTTAKNVPVDEEPFVPRYVYKTSALFMIYLIVSLSFVIAISQRAEATFNVQVTGEDKLPSYRRMNDTTLITVLADSSTVKLLSGGGALNLSCVNATGGGYKCTYSFPSAYQAPGAYTLSLQQASGSPATTTATYVVDGSPPLFTRADVTQLGGSVSASYDVLDKASAASSSCSGVQSVSLVVNDNTVATDAPASGSCVASGLLTGEAPGLNGETRIYLLATDRLGNTGTSQVITRVMDTVPPAIPSSFRLLRNNADVTQLSSEAATDIRVTLEVVVTEDRLASVAIDASSLTKDPSLAQAYKELRPSCANEDGVNTCTVPNVKLNPSSENVVITMTARDTSGNVATGTASKNLKLQNTKPYVTYLGTAAPRCEETCYVKTGQAELVALITAPGGMRGNGLFVDIGGTTVVARNCTSLGGDGWQCLLTAYVKGTSGTKKTLRVLPQSMDDLGNSVESFSREIIIDADTPSIVGAPKLDTSCPTAGQQLTVLVQAKDKTASKLKIFANTSDVTDRDTVESWCDPVPNKEQEFSCVLVLDSFVSIHTTGTVPIILSDQAGNSVKMTLELEVCEAEADATPNYIMKIEPSSSLPTVDKRVASLIPYRVLIPLKVTLKGSAKPVQVRRVTCDGIFTPGPSYVMNELSKAPVLVTHYYSQSVWPNGTVPLNCTLEFTIRRGNLVYVKPEVEKVNLALPLVRQELGNPGEAIREKQLGLAKEVQEMQKKIDKKAKLDDMLGKNCQMVENIAKMNNALVAIKGVLYAVSLVLVGFFGSGAALWAKSNLLLSEIHSFVNTYLWPPGWLPSAGAPGQAIGYFIKYVCAIYTCKLYDIDAWTSFGIEAASRSDAYGAWMSKGDNPQTLPDGYSWGPGGVAVDAQGNKLENVAQYTIVDDEMSVHITDPVEPGTLRLGFGTGYLAAPENYFIETKSGNIVDKQYYNAPERPKGSYVNLREYQEGYFDGMDSAAKNYFERNWIVDPYKNQKYDALCLPAQLYNLRKEKQLKCIQMKCIDEMAVKGLPITQCEQRYSTQHCLYVEGAQTRMHGEFAKKLLEAAGQVVLRVGISLGMSLLFRRSCPALYSITAIGADSATIIPDGCTLTSEAGVIRWSNLDCGAKSVGCGFFGLALSLPELMNMVENPWADWSVVPAGDDYCSGLTQWNVTEDGSA